MVDARVNNYVGEGCWLRIECTKSQVRPSMTLSVALTLTRYSQHLHVDSSIRKRNKETTSLEH
jgi:hypothetical protein